MVRIAVDAMGGDHAPGTVVDGVLGAAELFDDLELILVGHQDAIAKHFQEKGKDPSAFEIIHAAEVIGMDEAPVVALRRKRDSSIRVMVSLLKAGRCDAVFSAGNTGAVVAASTMLLGLLPGVLRAGIAVTLPIRETPVVLIDVGANVQCKPQHLFQYGLMATELSTRVYGMKDPSVGLLNIGEEEQKGNALVKETRSLFQDSSLRYLGNVEGREIFCGSCDVIVCDGFVGNIVLKVSEGLAEKIMEMLFRGLESIEEKDGSHRLQRQGLRSLATRLHYSEYGGAPLLGVDGIVIIGHGRSDGKAIVNALGWVREMQRSRVNEFIVEAVAEVESK